MIFLLRTLKFLHPVKQPKFYAFRMVSFFLATMGGIKINENTEVLSKEDEGDHRTLCHGE